MAAEEDFVLSFTGEETDNLLKHTESITSGHFKLNIVL